MNDVGPKHVDIGGQTDNRYKRIQGNTSKSGIKCVCLNARSIIRKNELNIMADDIKLKTPSRKLCQHMKYGYRRKQIAMRPYCANELPDIITVTIGVGPSISVAQHNQTEQRKIHNASNVR